MARNKQDRVLSFFQVLIYDLIQICISYMVANILLLFRRQ